MPLVLTSGLAAPRMPDPIETIKTIRFVFGNIPVRLGAGPSIAVSPPDSASGSTGLDPGIMNAAAYADTRPKVPNRDKKGFAIRKNQEQNRRVVIRIEQR